MSGTDVKTKLLLVDDRAENLVALEAVLAPLGQEIVAVRSGDEALRRLLDDDFAVILLDVLMPGLDGFETAALIRQRARTRHIPIIFLTAVSQQEEFVARGYDVGAVDYIAKPFHPDILRAKVGVFVELFRKNAEVQRQGELLRIAERREKERALEEARRASDKRYQELAESMPQMVWTAAPDGTISYVNRRWLDYAGVAADDAGARDWRRAVHPDDRGAVEAAWRAARAEKRDFELAVRFRRASDGAYRWHLVRAVPALDGVGGVAEWVGTSTDVDDRTRAEHALQFLADASKILAESLDHRTTLPLVAQLAATRISEWCVIHLKRDDGDLERVALAAATCERTEAALALLAGDEVPPPFFAPLTAPLDGGDAVVVSDGGPARTDGLAVESWIRAPIVARGVTLGELRLGTDGTRQLGALEVELTADLARRISNAVEASQLYAAAQRERTALEAAARVKDEFLAVLSHELRTPLNVTLGWAQMLRGGKLDAKTTEVALETVERSARTQVRLVDDLLDVSRIVTGKLRLQIADVDPASFLAAAIEIVQPAAAAKPVTLVVDVAPGLPRVRGDAARLQQIAWNLLANAIKFTRRGDQVRVSLSHRDEQIVLVVEDDGQGIDPDFLPHVFDRFSQANSSITRSHGGLGLGLSIVRHLTELHGGRVRAESAGLGRGARFVVELPDGSRATRRDAATPPAEAAPLLEGIRVLVVEDAADGRMLVKTMLEQCGARVRVAADGVEALTQLERERPDVLVSDIGLPRMDGYELVSRLRASEASGNDRLPALAMTAYASDADRRTAHAAGFDGHVSKPVDKDQLAQAIAKIARSRRHTPKTGETARPA